MKITKVLLLVFIVLMEAFAINAQDKNLVVRIAKLVIDTGQMNAYKAALKEHAEVAVKTEPGVLNLYAVYEKNNPGRVTVFEIYANDNAYQLHLRTPHFLKYKKVTAEMVKSLELIETVPISLQTKYKNAD